MKTGLEGSWQCHQSQVTSAPPRGQGQSSQSRTWPSSALHFHGEHFRSADTALAAPRAIRSSSRLLGERLEFFFGFLEGAKAKGSGRSLCQSPVKCGVRVPPCAAGMDLDISVALWCWKSELSQLHPNIPSPRATPTFQNGRERGKIIPRRFVRTERRMLPSSPLSQSL